MGGAVAFKVRSGAFGRMRPTFASAPSPRQPASTHGNSAHTSRLAQLDSPQWRYVLAKGDQTCCNGLPDAVLPSFVEFAYFANEPLSTQAIP